MSVSNTINMTIRIDKDLKKSVDSLFRRLGTSTNSAINMFLRLCEKEQSLCFLPTLAPAPSEELLGALQEVEDYKNGKIRLDTYKDVKELREALINN